MSAASVKGNKSTKIHILFNDPTASALLRKVLVPLHFQGKCDGKLRGLKHVTRGVGMLEEGIVKLDSHPFLFYYIEFKIRCGIRWIPVRVRRPAHTLSVR